MDPPIYAFTYFDLDQDLENIINSNEINYHKSFHFDLCVDNVGEINFLKMCE